MTSRQREYRLQTRRQSTDQKAEYRLEDRTVTRRQREYRLQTRRQSTDQKTEYSTEPGSIQDRIRDLSCVGHQCHGENAYMPINN